MPEWVVTFGDMMSLLLTFFIMLVSMSEIKEEERFQAMLESMRRQFGHDTAMAAIVPGEVTPRNSNLTTLASMGRAKRQDIMRGGNPVKAVQGSEMRVRTIRPGDNATKGGVIFFPEDSAELSEENKARLRQVARQIAGKPQKIEVRGHTSRKPIQGTDHWRLSYERCRVTMEFLVSVGIDAERIRLGAAAANEPINNEIDAEHRKRNARVEVLMWDEAVGETN
ncbi:MAG: flagellar motor protein MotB [Planctomycetota bacterium]